MTFIQTVHVMLRVIINVTTNFNLKQVIKTCLSKGLIKSIFEHFVLFLFEFESTSILQFKKLLKEEIENLNKCAAKMVFMLRRSVNIRLCLTGQEICEMKVGEFSYQKN